MAFRVFHVFPQSLPPASTLTPQSAQPPHRFKMSDEIDVEETPGYVAPKKVDLETLKNLDQDDEALQRWKAALLEGADGAG